MSIKCDLGYVLICWLKNVRLTSEQALKHSAANTAQKIFIVFIMITRLPHLNYKTRRALVTWGGKHQADTAYDIRRNSEGIRC